MEVNINKYNPISGKSYISYIESKKAVLNISNNGVNAALFQPNENSCRLSSYPPYSTLLNFNKV